MGHQQRHTLCRKADQWNKLSDGLKEVVSANFPVIYAIQSDQESRGAPGSSVPGERGLLCGTAGEMIQFVSVPDYKVRHVKKFFLTHGAPGNMGVQPFSSFRPDAH
jgi:hypothetical protein